MAHPQRAHELSVDAHAHVAVLSHRFAVETNRFLLFLLDDGVAHPQRAHPLAAHAHARVAPLWLDLLVQTDGPGDGDFLLLEGSEVGDALFQSAEPFSLVAQTPVAVDFVRATGSAFLQLVAATLEAFADVSSLNARLSSLQSRHLFGLKTFAQRTQPGMACAEACIACLLFRLSINAFLFLFSWEALHSASSADAGAIGIHLDLPLVAAEFHGAHPE